MLSITPYRLLSLCAFLLLSTASLAEEPRWYQVEVILFGQNSATFRDAERWPIDYRLPDELNAVDLLPPGTDANNPPQAFSMVDTASLQLGPEAERIQKNPDLSLLLHLGWNQPGLAIEQARGIKIRALRDDNETAATTDTPVSEPPVLEGVLTVSLSRYLHMNVDLLYREAMPVTQGYGREEVPGAERELPVDLFSLSEQGSGFPVSHWQVYRMNESRRMRSNELHYLDHPVIGMLVMITPL